MISKKNSIENHSSFTQKEAFGRGLASLETTRNVAPVAVHKYHRNIMWAGIGLVMLTLFILSSVVNRPSMYEYQNYDDAAYNSIGVQWASTGEWRPAFQPLGLARSENFFAANPVLTPYLTGVSIKLFGPDRWVFKLPSLIAFLVTGLALTGMIYVTKLQARHGLVVLFSYYACPWLYFSMNTARAEPLCIAGLYLAMLFSLVWSKSEKSAFSSVWLLLSGGLAVVVVWNHVLFAMSALLPVLAILMNANSKSGRRGILLWLAGASLMCVFLVVWRILPHWDSWTEQFLANASNNAAISNDIKIMDTFTSSKSFPLNELLEFKARLSTLGWLFICWYVGLPFLFLMFLRPTRPFLVAIIFVLAFLAVIEIKTPVLGTYVISSALALPLCLLQAAARNSDASWAGTKALLFASVVSIPILHAWLVLRPETRTNDWSRQEQQLEHEFSILPPRSVIWGGTALAMVPAWKQGHKYYMNSWSFFSNIPDAKEKLIRLNGEQSHYQVDFANGRWRVGLHQNTQLNVERGKGDK
jgi:hypothetical protein